MNHSEPLFVIKNGYRFKEKKCEATQLGIRALDSETLEIELEQPDPHFLYKLTQPFFFPVFGLMREPKWFNGPFLVRKNTNKRLLLECNPYFWDGKRTSFEQIDIQWITCSKAIYSLYEQKKVDWIGNPLNSFAYPFIQQLEKEGKLRTQKTARRSVLYFHTKHSLLSSPLVRRALSLCIDRVSICSTIYLHSAPLYPLIEENALSCFERGIKELGITRDALPSLLFTYPELPDREKLAMHLQSSWQKALGIKIEIESIPWNLYRSNLERGFFELTATSLDTLDDTMEFFERFLESSSWNFSRWAHPQYEQLIREIKAEKNPEHREERMLDLKKILELEVPFTPLFDYVHLYTHHPELEGYVFDREG
jgi:oligopeptide transport system substrate-binding protein